jgi:LPXTG-site transpeptidase (sortase) family protein
MANRSKYHRTDDNDDIVVSKPFQDSIVSNTAADLIREKVAQIYKEEPDAKEEIEEAEAAKPKSKHQKFMFELSNSGKDLATIQTEWHDYYANLDSEEKYEVWQEFYDSQSSTSHHPAVNPTSPKPDQKSLAENRNQVIKPKRPKAAAQRKPKEIQAAIKDKVTANGKLTAKHQLQSLMFGLGMGFLVIFIFLFGFFNEVIIAPFIQPSRASADTPIIINTSVAPTTTPEVIIPKINVEIPVDYNETSTNESTIESDLEDGVVHYPTTVLPGQDGNAAFFGHSSNNIFNGGKYKFAFVLLHTLVNGDTFYLTYSDKVYIYKVISKNIVSPSDVSVLNPVAGQTATATLITCDPPGTSINRLVVVGQQISPDPSTDTAAATTKPTGSSSTTKQLPGNGPTLWEKFYATKLGKVITIVAILTIIGFGAFKYNRRLRPAI